MAIGCIFSLRGVVTVTREPFEWDIWSEVEFPAPETSSGRGHCHQNERPVPHVVTKIVPPPTDSAIQFPLGNVASGKNQVPMKTPTVVRLLIVQQQKASIYIRDIGVGLSY